MPKFEEFDDDTQDISFFSEPLFDSDDENADQFSSKKFTIQCLVFSLKNVWY